MRFHWMALASLASIFAVTGSASAREADDDHGGRAVYVLSNDAGANSVLVFDRARDGSLHAAGGVATGGTGSGGGLGTQGALTASRDGRWLFAVNPGSHSVSALRREHDGTLTLVDVADSGGDLPASVTESGGLVYVLNTGARQNISGLTFDGAHLRTIPGSTRPLSSPENVGAAQIAFTPDAEALVVTEKGTNRIDGFVVRLDGTPGDAVVTASSGQTPFGFAFGRRGTLVVSDAYGGAPGAGALSSYHLDDGASAHLVTGPLADGRTAPCWVAVADEGRIAFTTNAHDGTLSSFAIGSDGSLTLVESIATSIGSTSTPLDLNVAGAYVYVRDGGTQGIDIFRRGADGTLTSLGAIDGLPASANGLVAR